MWISYGTARVVSLSASAQTFKIQLKTTNTGYSASMKNARITAIPMASIQLASENRGYGESETASPTALTTLQDKLTTSVTPTATRKYLALGTAFVRNESSAAEGVGRFEVEGANIGETIYRAAGSQEYLSLFGLRRYEWGPTPHATALRFRTTVADTSKETFIKNARILLLPIGDCQGQPNGTSCSDGNACNGAETCQSNVCTAGTPLPNGTSCSDSDICTGPDSCQAGLCQGAALDCVDSPSPVAAVDTATGLLRVQNS